MQNIIQPQNCIECKNERPDNVLDWNERGFFSALGSVYLNNIRELKA